MVCWPETSLIIACILWRKWWDPYNKLILLSKKAIFIFLHWHIHTKPDTLTLAYSFRKPSATEQWLATLRIYDISREDKRANDSNVVAFILQFCDWDWPLDWLSFERPRERGRVRVFLAADLSIWREKIEIRGSTIFFEKKNTNSSDEYKDNSWNELPTFQWESFFLIWWAVLGRWGSKGNERLKLLDKGPL